VLLLEGFLHALHVLHVHVLLLKKSSHHRGCTASSGWHPWWLLLLLLLPAQGVTTTIDCISTV
jgi:hypothetical protein